MSTFFWALYLELVNKSFYENNCLYFQQLSSQNQHRPINLKYSTLQTDRKVQSRVLSFDDIDDIATPSIDVDAKIVVRIKTHDDYIIRQYIYTYTYFFFCPHLLFIDMHVIAVCSEYIYIYIFIFYLYLSHVIVTNV